MKVLKNLWTDFRDGVRFVWPAFPWVLFLAAAWFTASRHNWYGFAAVDAIALLVCVGADNRAKREGRLR